jgi:hypothetical protein
MTDPAAVETWSTCSVCGGAVPPDTHQCPTCGQERSVTTREIPRLPTPLRTRVRLLQTIRIGIVLVVAVGILWAVGSAVISGPTTFPDPLTTRGTLQIGAGNFTYLSGAITGEDYIDGNYSVVHPAGVPINFLVFNSSSFNDFVSGKPASPVWSTTNSSQARIVFAAPYTDTFWLVFQNPYPPGSGIDVIVYEVTNYQTNVVIG